MMKVLFISPGWEQETLLARVHDAGHEIFGVFPDGSHSRSAPFREMLKADARDIAGILKFAKAKDVDAVISNQCDYSYFSQAVVAESLGLPGPSVRQAFVATNKHIQRVESKKKGLLIPEFELCLGAEDVHAFAEKHGYPVITKPLDNRGSFGVNRIDSKEHVKEAFLDAVANSHSRLVLVEKFIEGTMVTVDGYAFPKAGVRSLAVASKKQIGSRRQVAIDIIYPAELPEKTYDYAFSSNEQVNRSLGFTFGWLHSEYLATPEGKAYLIETANRGGGCYTSEVIVPEACGIDVVGQYVSDCTGAPADLFAEKGGVDRNPVILKFFSLPPGKVKKVGNLDAIRGRPEVLKFRLNFKEGGTIQPITTAADRHGFIIAKAASRDDLRARSDEIINSLKVTYEGVG